MHCYQTANSTLPHARLSNSIHRPSCALKHSLPNRAFSLNNLRRQREHFCGNAGKNRLHSCSRGRCRLLSRRQCKPVDVTSAGAQSVGAASVVDTVETIEDADTELLLGTSIYNTQADALERTNKNLEDLAQRLQGELLDLKAFTVRSLLITLSLSSIGISCMYSHSPGTLATQTDGVVPSCCSRRILAR